MIKCTATSRTLLIHALVLIFMMSKGLLLFAAEISDPDMVSLSSMDSMDVKDFVKKLSIWQNKNIILEAKDLGKFQVLGPEKISKREIYEAFLSFLDYMSLSAIETDQVMRVQPKNDSLGGNVVPVAAVGQVSYSDKIFTQIFPLKNVSADHVRNVLSSLVSTKSINIFEPTNSIIITQTGFLLRRIAELIEILDVKSANVLSEVVHLKYQVAGDLEKKITDFLNTETIPGGPSFKIIVMDALNSLMLSGSIQKVKRAKELIQQMDVPEMTVSNNSGNGVYVRPLMFSDAKKLATLLTSVTPQKSPEGVGGKNTNLQILADEGTNSLLFKGEYDAFRSMNSIVRRLDIEKPQVFLECEILNLNAQNNFSFLPSLLGGVANQDGTGLKAIVGYEAKAMTPLIVAQATQTTANNSNSIAAAASAFNNNLTIGTFAGSNIKVPGIGTISPGVLINLMKSDANTGIVSSPKILAVDNDESNLTVGETYNFVTSKLDESGNLQGTPSKETVDFTLKFKPTMTGSQALNMLVEIDANYIESFFDNGIPQTAKKKARQLINLKTGQTFLISGIKNLSRVEYEKKVPFLGSIPILGYLFTSRKVSNDMNYTFIFVTAHVIRGPNDLQALYEAKFKSIDPVMSRKVMGINSNSMMGNEE